MVLWALKCALWQCVSQYACWLHLVQRWRDRTAEDVPQFPQDDRSPNFTGPSCILGVFKLRRVDMIYEQW